MGEVQIKENQANPSAEGIVTEKALPEYRKEDFPGGEIRNVLALDQPDTELSDLEAPRYGEGQFYMEGGLGLNLQIGDDLKEDFVPVEVLRANQDNQLVQGCDIFSGTPFKEGELVALVGQYKAPLSLDTLRAILIENTQDKSAPADITITAEDLTKP